MKRNAIYPGTFDPITFGHLDVIKKSLNVVDNLIVAVSEEHHDNYLFSPEERLKIVEKAVYSDIKLSKKRIKIVSFNFLTVALCHKYKAKIIIRGLRAVSDFEYEFQLAGMNKKLNNRIETIFLMSELKNQVISSKFVKEIASLNGDISKFASRSTIKAIKTKITWKGLL